MGIIHFSAAFDQALLMVTKTVMTICIHSVIFGSQVSIICFYFVSEHLIWPLHTKVLKTMVPTAILSVTFGVMEASFVGLHWTNTVLKSGTGALTTFWVIVKAFLVLAYATTFLVGLIPWKNLHFPSALFIISSNWAFVLFQWTFESFFQLNNFLSTNLP